MEVDFAKIRLMYNRLKGMVDELEVEICKYLNDVAGCNSCSLVKECWGDRFKYANIYNESCMNKVTGGGP